MKKLILLLLLLIVSQSFGLYYYKYTVDSSKVTENVDHFPYQVEILDPTNIDDVINSATDVVVCDGDYDTSDIQPTFVVYKEGVGLYVSWDGEKDTTVNKEFYIVLDSALNHSNDITAYTNSNYTNRWSGDDTSGTTAYDDIGSNDGTMTSVGIGAAKVGDGFVFNASNDRVDLGYVSALSSATELTVETIVKFTDFSTFRTPFICYRIPAARVFFQANTTDLGFYLSTLEGTIALSGNVTAGEQTHIVFAFNAAGATDADRLRAFINGEKVTLSYSGTAPANTGSLATTTAYLGYTANSHNGTSDEIGVLDTSVSDEFVTDRYTMLFDTTFATLGDIRCVAAGGEADPNITLLTPTQIKFTGSFFDLSGKRIIVDDTDTLDIIEESKTIIVCVPEEFVSKTWYNFDIVQSIGTKRYKVRFSMSGTKLTLEEKEL